MMTRRTTLSALGLVALIASSAVAQNPAPTKPSPKMAAHVAAVVDTTKKKPMPKKPTHKPKKAKPDSTSKKPN